MTEGTYTSAVIELLGRLEQTQGEALDRVAAKAAEALEGGGLVHLFGSGHSVIPTLDAFPRYGSFAGLHPLTDPRLMWHNVLAPGGVRELLWLERTDGYIKQFLDHEPLNAGDVLIVYSHGGRNAAPIEAAQYGTKRGLFTVAVTSVANRNPPSDGQARPHLSEVTDEVIDTGVPVEDAVVDIQGWDRPVGGSSTVIASVVSHEIITRSAKLLGAKGKTLPTFVSPTVPGATLASNDEVFAEHRALLHAAEGKAIT